VLVVCSELFAGVETLEAGKAVGERGALLALVRHARTLRSVNSV